MKTALRISVIGLLLCSFAFPAEPAPRAATASTITPVEGTLPNGLRYTLLPHRRDLGRVSVRLVVHAGSLDERDTERGYAHFVEHLAFEGSRNFPPGKLREFFQSLGLNDGADLNATTSHLDTTYRIDLPVGRAAQLVDALRVMRDFADGIEFPESEVTRERGVVLAEAEARDNDDLQLTRQQIASLFPGTTLAGRFPIGDRADLERATAATLRAFYRRCYSPSRMTLVIVGDIDPAAATKLLTGHFASLRADRSAVAQVVPPAPTVAGKLQARVLTSASALAANVALVVVTDPPAMSRAAQRSEFVHLLAFDALNRRLTDYRSRHAQRIGDAAASLNRALNGSFQQATVHISAATDDWEYALAVVETELRRAVMQGFAPAEIDEQVATRLAWARAAVDVLAGSPPDGIATDIASALAAHHGWQHPAVSAALVAEFAPTVSPEELSRALGALLAEQRAHLHLTRRTPPAGGDEAVLAAWRASTARALEPAPPAAPPLEFRYSLPATPGTVATRRAEADLGLELVTFANGAHLNLRASRTEPGRFRLAARLGRGLVDFSPERPGLGHIAAHLFRHADLRRHTRAELNRLFSMRALSEHATFDHRYLVMISGPVSELPFALRVLAAEFSDTKLDPARFAEALSDTANCRAAQLDDGGDHAREGIMALMAGGDPRLREPLPTAIGDYTYAEVIQWLRAHWLDGPLEIALTGDIDPEVVLPAAAATIGALPRQRELIDTSAARPSLRPMPAHETEKVPLADATAAVRVAWPVSDASTPAALHALHLATDVLVDRLHQALRHELGATYSPAGYLQTLPQHHAFAFVSVALTFAPDRAPELTRRAIELAGELAKNGVTPKEFARLREPLRSAAIEDLRSNEWWANAILAHARSDPLVLGEARALPGAFDRLTRDDVNRAAAAHFDPANASSLIVLPVAPAAATEDQEPITAADFVARGNLRSNRGELDTALADYGRALVLDSKSDDAYLGRGFARMRRGDVDGALADTTRAIELNPKNAMAYVNRSAAKLTLGAVDGAIADATKAIELDPTLALAYGNRAGARFGRGDLDGCIADATRALELDPRNATAYANRGAAYANKGDRDRAIADSTKAIEFDPNNLDAYHNRGFQRQAGGDLEGALEDFDRAIALNPSAINSLFQRGLIRAQKGQSDKALADYDRIIEVSPNLSGPYNNRGVLRQQKGDLDGAFADFDHALRVDTQNVDAFNNRGHVRQLKGDLEGAISDFNQALALNPNYAKAYTNRGNAKKAKGDTLGALDDLDRAGRLTSPVAPHSSSPGASRVAETSAGDAAALVRRGDGLRAERNFDGAITAYNQAILLDPTSAAAYANRGAARAARNDRDGAIGDYTRALDLLPGHAPFLVQRGDLWRAKTDYARGDADYTEAIRVAPTSAAAFLGRGYTREARSDYRGAVADFNRVIELNPGSADAHNGRGYARFSRGELDAALADLNRAIELAPRYPAAFNNRGLVKRAQGDLPAALADFDQAIKLSSRYTNAYSNRASTRQALGDLAGAVADYDKSVETGTSTHYSQLHRFLCLRRLGRQPSATEFAAAVEGWPAGWAKTMGGYAAGKISAEELLRLAGQGRGRVAVSRPCEAHFVIGLTELIAGHFAEARVHFEQSVAQARPDLAAFVVARAELARPQH